jgi:hypothetical protein
MLNSFEQAIVYMIGNGILNEFKIRIDAIHQETIAKLENEQNFNAIIERLILAFYNRNFFNSAYILNYI